MMRKSVLLAGAGAVAAGAMIGGLVMGSGVVAIFSPAPAPTPVRPVPAPTPPGEGPEGITIPIIVDGPDGSYLQLCRAEAMVTMDGDKVKEIKQKGKDAKTAVGEAVRNEFNTPSGIAFPAHRGPDGVLTYGWASCERAP